MRSEFKLKKGFIFLDQGRTRSYILETLEERPIKCTYIINVRLRLTIVNSQSTTTPMKLFVNNKKTPTVDLTIK